MNIRTGLHPKIVRSALFAIRPALFAVGTALFTVGFALAQDQKPDDPKANLPPPDPQEQEQQTYAGTSILSRDKSLIAERGGKLLDFRFYGEVTGIYDSGLTPLSTDTQGNLINV